MARELRGLRYVPDGSWLVEELTDAAPLRDFAAAIAWYTNHLLALSDQEQAFLGCNDRYHLLVNLLGRKDLLHPWLFARCREIEADPDGHLDLWARYHGKSSLITFGGIIQEVLCDPELTVAIFSHTQPLAKAFLVQIKRELEGNDYLKQLYADVLRRNPRSESEGIVVKRKSNPKEATVEARKTSLHCLDKAADFRVSSYACANAQLRDWRGGRSLDPSRVGHIHLSWAPGSGEFGRAFYHGGGRSFARAHRGGRYAGRHRHRHCHYARA